MKTLIAILAACLMLGCATPQRTAALECGAGGFGAGYLLCKALGGKDDTCLAMGAAGGGVGAAACYNYADQLDKRRQALSGREDDLDAQLAYVRGLNQDAEAFNDQLRARVGLLTQRMDTAVAQRDAGRMSQAQLAQAHKALDDEIATGRRQLDQGRSALDELKQFRSRQEQLAQTAGAQGQAGQAQAGQAQEARRLQALDAEIARNEALLAQIDRQTVALESQRQRV